VNTDWRRPALEQALGYGLTDAQYLDLTQAQAFTDWVKDPDNLDILADYARDLFLHFGRGPGRGLGPLPALETDESVARLVAGVSAPEKGRHYALRGLIARCVADELLVKAFRVCFLPSSLIEAGRLLELHQVREWLDYVANRDPDEEARWADLLSCVREHKEEVAELLLHGLRLKVRILEDLITSKPDEHLARIEEYNSRILAFQDADGGVVLFEARRNSAAIRAADEICRAVSNRYLWYQPQCATFLFAGGVPELPRSDARFVERDPSALSRIRLELDPFLSPRDVARIYQEARGELRRRFRDLSLKHAALAGACFFTNESRRDWPDHLRNWNRAVAKDHPDWQYNKLALFRRDAEKARQRMLFPRFELYESEATQGGGQDVQ
jgi:hypothetical protein